MFFNPNQNINNTEYYNLLNVNKNATSSEIKKSYRKLAMKHHPDKGGDSELFKKITEAFQVLSDDNKRKLYDSGGKTAVQSGVDNSNIFNMFNNNQNTTKIKKGPSLSFTLNLSLEDIYKGVVKHLNIKRISIEKKSLKKCNKCDGNGYIIKSVQMGPMIRQVQQPCYECNGTKYFYKKKKYIRKSRSCNS